MNVRRILISVILLALLATGWGVKVGHPAIHLDADLHLHAVAHLHDHAQRDANPDLDAHRHGYTRADA